MDEFEFVAGYPTAEASEALYDEMDYQRAVQAYIWATPMLNSMAMRAAFAEFGVTEHDRKIMAFEYSLLPQHIWMTANSTTPYFWMLMDLRESGPMVVEIPPQDVLGGLYGFWMRALVDFGLTGPDRVREAGTWCCLRATRAPFPMVTSSSSPFPTSCGVTGVPTVRSSRAHHLWNCSRS